MKLQFTHPYFLLLLLPAVAWVIGLAWKSDVQLSPVRRWVVVVVRLLVVICLVFALAGFQWLRPLEGMNFASLPKGGKNPSQNREGQGRKEKAWPHDDRGQVTSLRGCREGPA